LRSNQQKLETKKKLNDESLGEMTLKLTEDRKYEKDTSSHRG
jgi:hypothetical protein